MNTTNTKTKHPTPYRTHTHPQIPCPPAALLDQPSKSPPINRCSLRLFRNCFTFLTALFLICAGSSQAEFRLFDNFEDAQLGPVNAQNGWASAGGDNRIVTDPADPNNQILYVPSQSSILRKSLLAENLTISNDNIRMMFMRIRIGNKQTFSVGLSPLTYPSEFSDFAPEVGMANSAQNLDLRAWDDDGGNYELLTQLSPDRWYNMWLLIDAYNNYYRVWLNDTPSADAETTDKLSAPDADEAFDFRSGQNADLATFYIKTAGGASGTNFGPVYFDDIYLELKNVRNLKNPLMPITLITADANHDKCVNFLDFAPLADNWLTGPQPPAMWEDGDFNNDNNIRHIDLYLLAEHWLTGCCT